LSHPRPAGPVLKWAGGKRQLLAQLRPFFPAQIPRYHEPFLGSAAVFFDLCAGGHLRSADAVLSDDNADLIGTYLRVRDSTDDVLATLMRLATRHARAGRDHYYRVRDEQFNPGRRQWLAAGGQAHRYPVALAAMLIYLNRTGYNGLFRLNAEGEFNVPAGRYDAPSIVREDRITAAAVLLRGATIQRAPFELALQQARAGDVVYLDPPYAPLSRTAQFTSYTAAGFGPDEQAALQRAVIALASRGASVLLSNSAAPAVRQLYADSPEARSAGLQARTVPARRAINSRASGRGVVLEYLITNVGRLRARSP
jgi:DNA adenine methylase